MNFSQQTKIMDFVEDKVHFDNLSYDILDEIVFHLSAIEIANKLSLSAFQIESRTTSASKQSGVNSCDAKLC